MGLRIIWLSLQLEMTLVTLSQPSTSLTLHFLSSSKFVLCTASFLFLYLPHTNPQVSDLQFQTFANLTLLIISDIHPFPLCSPLNLHPETHPPLKPGSVRGFFLLRRMGFFFLSSFSSPSVGSAGICFNCLMSRNWAGSFWLGVLIKSSRGTSTQT